MLAAAALLGGGTVAAAADDGGDRPVTFTVGLQNEVDSFNPFLGIEAESYEMWALTYDYLISYSMEDMSPQPGLASEWETSEDGLTWTFTIRDDVTWSDGEPLTADDIAFTFNRVLDGGPEAATWGSYLGSVETISAPDDTTVQLQLSEPNAVLPLIPIPIVPEHVWSDIDEDEIKTYPNEPSGAEPVVGSGPFRFVEGTAGGSTYRFEANPEYWKGTSNLDEVVFRVYKSEDTSVQAVLGGEIDAVDNISALQVKSLQDKDNVEATVGDSPGFDEIAFNTGSINLDTGDPIGDPNPAVLDPAFRYALGFAVDRELIVEKAYQGAGDPGASIIPPLYGDYYWEPPEDVAFEFDLERADQLLTEAGYELDADGVRSLPDGTAMKPLRMYARSESPTSVDVMDYFKEWLGELGIPSEITAVESGKLTGIILDGEFDVFEWGWYVEPDPDSMLSYMTCDQLGSWSDSWYCNEEYDALYEQQQVELDDEARAEMVQRMQEILYLDAPYLVTAYSGVGQAYRSDKFTGFQPQPDPGGIWLMQYGVRNYLEIEPVTASASDAADDGGSMPMMVGGGIAVALVAGAGLVWGMRRRASAGERE